MAFFTTTIIIFCPNFFFHRKSPRPTGRWRSLWWRCKALAIPFPCHPRFTCDISIKLYCHRFHWGVTLLNCYSTELLLDWTVTWLSCCLTELLLDWSVTLLNCHLTELLLDWTVSLLNCYFTEVWLYWAVTLLICYFTELLPDRAVTLLSCYFTELLLYWAVALLNRYYTELVLAWAIFMLLYWTSVCLSTWLNCCFTGLFAFFNLRNSEASQLDFLWVGSGARVAVCSAE